MREEQKHENRVSSLAGQSKTGKEFWGSIMESLESWT